MLDDIAFISFFILLCHIIGKQDAKLRKGPLGRIKKVFTIIKYGTSSQNRNKYKIGNVLLLLFSKLPQLICEFQTYFFDFDFNTFRI